MTVNNINGTSTYTCNCGSWLDHWKKFSGQALPTWCSEKSCANKPEVGAHVQKAGYTDTAWYIVPLCSKHNAKTGESLDLANYAVLVPANVSETCAKRAANYGW